MNRKATVIVVFCFYRKVSFAKGGEGFGKAKEVQGSFSAFNNIMSGLDLGQKTPERKVTIDISIVIWDIKPGNTKPDISSY